MPEMRVAVLTSLFPSPQRPFEGVFAERRWRVMADRGHSVTVVQPLPYSPPLVVRGTRAALRKAPRQAWQNGMLVHRPRYLHVPGCPVWNARRFVGVGGRACRDLGPEVVVADYAWPAAAVVPRLHRTGVPGVVSARGSDLRIAGSHATLERLFIQALQASAGWCGVAEHLVREMDRMAERPGRGRLVPNGVDADLFQIRPRPAARSQLGLDPDSTVVLVVGHLIPRKDPLLALRTFASAAPSLADARLVFIGDGPLLSELRGEARQLGIDDRTSTPGVESPSRLAQWYAATDCLLLCSSWEGRPNVVLEALACGRPVLATHTDGSAELLHEHPAFLADDRDPGRLGQRLLRLLDDPPDPARLRDSVLPLTWQSSCDVLEECLRTAISGDRP
jgi:glycosyltransferase involved in cell wall biosynthesis